MYLISKVWLFFDFDSFIPHQLTYFVEAKIKFRNYKKQHIITSKLSSLSPICQISFNSANALLDLRSLINAPLT